MEEKKEKDLIELLDCDQIVNKIINKNVYSEVHKIEIADRVIGGGTAYLGISDAISTPCAQAMFFFGISHLLSKYKFPKQVSALLNMSLFGLWGYFYGQYDVLGSPLHYLMFGASVYSLVRNKPDWKSALAAGLITLGYYFACLSFIKYGLPVDFW